MSPILSVVAIIWARHPHLGSAKVVEDRLGPLSVPVDEFFTAVLERLAERLEGASAVFPEATFWKRLRRGWSHVRNAPMGGAALDVDLKAEIHAAIQAELQGLKDRTAHSHLR